MPRTTRRRVAGGAAKLSPGIKILLLAVALCLYGGLLVGAQPSDAADALTSQPNISGRSQEGFGDSLSANEAAKDQTIALSPQEKAWLRDHPVIRVAQDPGWPPIEFVDGQGQPSGMAADYLKLIEQRLGIKFQRVPTSSWQEAYAKLKRWEIDMTTSVTVTPERTEFWAFTKPYMKIPIAIFAQSDVTYLANMRELSGKKVAVVAGYAVDDWIPKEFPKIRLVKVNSARDGLYLLQQGEVFAFIDNMLVVSYYLAKLKVANVKIAGETPYLNAQSMAVRKDWPILVGILQKALDSISQRERDEIYQKWLPLRYEHGFNYTLLWQVLAVFLVILLGLVVWNRKLAREIRQRKAAENALGSSKERFRQLFRIAAIPMAFVDKNGVVVDMNDRFIQTFGYTQEDVPTLESWWQKAYPDPGYRQEVIDTWSAGIQRAVKSNTDIEPNEYRVTCKDGTVRTIVISGAVLGEDFLAVFFDITERKQAEEALSRSEERYRTIVDTANEGVWAMDARFRTTFVNPNMAEMLGYKPEEMLGRSVDSFMFPEDLADHSAKMHRRVEGQGEKYERRFRGKDGREVWTIVSATVLRNEGGSFGGSFGMFTDITERKKMEVELKETERVKSELIERLNSAQQIARIGSWEWNLKTNNVWWSDETYRIFGVNPESFAPSFESNGKLIHPDDFENYVKSFEHCFKTGEPLDLDVRLIVNDGILKHCNAKGRIIYNDSGQQISFVGTILDITERKLADEELRRTNRALRTLSQCSQILVRAREEKEVLQDFCRIITGDGGYRMAWVGFAEHDEAKSVRPVAQMGFEEGYLAAANITWADTERGRGPTGKAIRTGHTVVARDLLKNQDYAPWRDEATKRGYASSIAIPLISGDQVLGALNIYASEVDAFNDVEVELLEKVAQTLAYGIIALRAENHRRQAEEALQRSENEFRAAFENAPEGMALLDLKRRFLKVNSRLCEMLGYSEDEILGNSFNRFTHPDDQQGGRDRWREFLAGDLSVKRAQKRYIHKNGQVVWVVVSNSAISNSQGEVNYILAHIYDITDRKRAEDELRQANESLLLNERDLRESQRIAHVGSWRLDIASNEVVWSEELYNMYGFDQALPPPPYTEHQKLFTPESWERLSAALSKTIETGIPYELELETVRENGSRGWMWVRGETVLDARGATVGLWGAAQDITDRKLIEQERVRLESQLRQSQKMEAVGTLAGGIAHDFNNILAAIMGYTEIALAEAEEGKSNRAELQGVLQAATRAKGLVQQILTFSRRAEHSLKLININEAVVSAGNLLKQTLPKMIEIQIDLSGELAPAMGNPYQIEQILMNLGTNARDAMPDGGILTIATSRRRVEGVACLACAQPVDGDYVIITVSDTGVGMTEEELSRVFEPFYTTKEVGKGTGLGLSTIFGIVGSHNGHITCSSVPGKGTSFSIYLPPVAQAGEQPKRAAIKPAAGGNETILVVDDEQSIVDIATRHLTNSGYKALTANSGEEALEVYKDKADEIALVILDLSMPGMGGHKCLRELRSLAPALKVIVATGYSRDADLNESTSAVASALLSKPFSKNELLKTVRKVLDA